MAAITPATLNKEQAEVLTKGYDYFHGPHEKYSDDQNLYIHLEDAFTAIKQVAIYRNSLEPFVQMCGSDAVQEGAARSEDWPSNQKIVEYSDAVKAVMSPNTDAQVEVGKIKDICGLVEMLDQFIKAFSDPVEARTSSPAEFEKDADSVTLSPSSSSSSVDEKDEIIVDAPDTKKTLCERFKNFIVPGISFLALLIGIILTIALV